MKHQCFGDYHTKKVYHLCLHRNHQSLSIVSSKNHQQRLINQAAMKHQNLKYSTLKALLIKNVCVQIFVVSSMVLQRVINESSKKKQWKSSDQMLTQQKLQKSKRFPSKLSMFQTWISRVSSTNHRQSSNETSMFPRLGQLKHLWSSMFACKCSL